MDDFDRRILKALRTDGSLTNAALSDIVGLSASQCSRRRSALESAGVIEGYRARLNPKKLGLTIRVIIRVNLHTHGIDPDQSFLRWLDLQPEVQSAFSVSGDVDYILDVCTRDMESFGAFMHDRLLKLPQIARVRSDFVMRTLKDGLGPDPSTP